MLIKDYTALSLTTVSSEAAKVSKNGIRMVY